MIRMPRITYRLHQLSRGVGGVDVRHHHAVGAGVEIARDQPRLVRVRPHDGSGAGDTRRAAHVLHALDAGHAVLAVDENGVEAEAADELHERRRGMIGIDHRDDFAARELLLDGQ